MNSPANLTMVRATKKAALRIDKLAHRLAACRGGRWPRPAVIDAALDALDRETKANIAAFNNLTDDQAKAPAP